MSQEYYERTRKPLLTMPESRAGKIGCWVLIGLWFVLLLTPCGLFFLASTGDVTLHHANVPEPASHPLIQVKLVSEARNTGLQFVRSVIMPVEDETQMCLETHVNYFLWRNQSGDDQSTVFCDCYQRSASNSADWQLTDTAMVSCDRVGQQ